jgi:flagellin
MTSHKIWLGLLVLLSPALTGQAMAGGNLVMNGGFETGAFTDWSLSGNTQYAMVTDKTFGSKPGSSYAAHGGSDYALLGPVGSLGTMSQTIATTAGQSYTFSWWLASDGDFANEFDASWNGTQVFDHQDIPVQGYVEYSFTVQATGSSTVIEFSYRDDPGYLSLDDVSVTGSISAQSVPEPSSAVLACIGTLMIVAVPLRSRWLRKAR